MNGDQTDNPSTSEEAETGARPKARDIGFGVSGDSRTGPADLLDSDLDDLPTLPRPPIDVDVSTAQPARVADYLRGGTANFAADRAAIDYITEALPGGIETARDTLLAGRAFHHRVIRHVVGSVGVRQILYAAWGVAAEEPIHEIARATTPGVRVIYVVTDDNVMAHAHRLKVSTPEVTTDYVRCSPDNPEQLLRQARHTLDLDEPILANVDLQMLPDDLAERIIGLLQRSMCPGSYLVVQSTTADTSNEALADMMARLDEMVDQSKMFLVRFRSHAEVARLLDGFELLEPGIVPLDEWRPDRDTPPRSHPEVPLFVSGAVARKL